MIRKKPTLRHLLSSGSQDDCCVHYVAQQVGIAKFFAHCTQDGSRLVKEGHIFSYYSGSQLLGQMVTQDIDGVRQTFQTILVRREKRCT